MARLQPLSQERADRIECECGRLDHSDHGDEAMGHPHPHLELSIDTGRNRALDMSSRVIEQYFVVADMNADRRQP